MNRIGVSVFVLLLLAVVACGGIKKGNADAGQVDADAGTADASQVDAGSGACVMDQSDLDNCTL